MARTRRLPYVPTLSSSDEVVVYSNALGDDASATLSTLADFLRGDVASAQETQYASPNAAGFNITVSPVNAGADVFLLITPVGAMAQGAVTLPANPVEAQTVLVSSTQPITAFMVNGNGALVNGAPTGLPANSSFAMRYEPVNASWYLVSGGGDGTVGPAGPPGATGGTGPAGPGVPTGGLAGQILAKVNSISYNTQWIDPPSGGSGTGVTDGDKGDITVSGGGTSYTIDAGVVTLSKMAPLAAGSLIGNATGGSATPTALSFAAAKAALAITGADVSGTVVPVASNRNAVVADNNGNLIFSAAYNLTLPTGLGGFNATVFPPVSGNATISVSGGATINGGTTSVTRSGSNPFMIINVGTNAYVVTDNTSGGSGDVTTGGTQTLTNKTIDGGNNTLQNIPQSAVTGLPAALAGAGKVVPIGFITANASKTDANTSAGTLATFTLPANTMAAGDELIIRGRGSFASTTTVSKNLVVSVGGTQVFISADNTSNATGSFEFEARMFARSTSSQVTSQGFQWGAPGINGNTPTVISKDLTATQTILVTSAWNTAGSGSQSITLMVCTAVVVKGA